MKIRLLFISIVMMIMMSCDKENDKIKPDDILYSNLNSPITAYSVRDWDTKYPGCGGDIPIPSDSLITVFLDVDNDTENDYKINFIT